VEVQARLHEDRRELGERDRFVRCERAARRSRWRVGELVEIERAVAYENAVRSEREAKRVGEKARGIVDRHRADDRRRAGANRASEREARAAGETGDVN